MLGMVALLSCLAACASNRGTSPSISTTPPNIVLIFADDLGYGELGCYGQTRIKTPHIDALAADGARFTQFYTAAPVCAPSRSALITGQHLGHTPNRDNGEVQPEGQIPLPPGTTTMAHVLQGAGYTTACIGKWGLGPVGSSGDPSLAGFDLFFGYNCQRQAHSYYPTHLWRNGERIALPGNEPKKGNRAIYAGDLLIDEAVRFIESCAANDPTRPFFLAYTTPLPHLALQMPETVLARYAGAFEETPYTGGKGYTPHDTPRAAYAAMISRLDDEVGMIREALARAGVAHNTLIFFTSDNGPTHDVGGVDTEFFDSAGGLRGRKGSVWEGGIREPAIAAWPGHIAAGEEIAAQAWTVDLLPTFAAAAGVASLPPSVQCDGINLLPLLERGAPLDREFLYWPFPGYGGQEAVRVDDWKLVRRGMNAAAKNGKPMPAWQLFNLSDDPREERDVAAAHPEIVAQLSAIAAREYTPSERYPLGDLESPRE